MSNIALPFFNSTLPVIEEQRCPQCKEWSILVGGKNYRCSQCGVWRLKDPAAVTLGRKGGIARANSLTPEYRQEIGRLARKAGIEKAHTRKERKELMDDAREYGTHTTREWLQLVLYCEERCVSCGLQGLKLTKDHIIPVSLGGSDRIDNLQPLCQPCNSAKHNKPIDYRPPGWWDAFNL